MEKHWTRFVGLTALFFALISFFGTGVYILFFSTPKSEHTATGAQSTPLVTIRFIDMQRLFDESDRGKQQKAAFAARHKQHDRDLKTMMARLKATQAQYQQLLKSGRQADAIKLIAPFQAAQKRFADLQQQTALTEQKAQADIDQTFSRQIKVIAGQLRTRKKVDAIEGTDPHRTLALDPRLDITQEALKQYNAQFPPDMASKK